MEVDYTNKDLRRFITNVLIPCIQKECNKALSQTVRQYPAEVVSVSGDGLSADVKLNINNENTILTNIPNKSGVVLSSGDLVNLVTIIGDFSNAYININKFGTDVDASKITIGTMIGNRISGGTLILGGKTEGQLIIEDINNNIISQQDKDGIIMYQGNYRMQEDTGNQFVIGSYKNFILDGSFESLGLGGIENYINGVLIDRDLIGNNYWNILSGSPKILDMSTDIASASIIGIKFGNRAVVTSANDIIYKTIPFAGYDKTFTVSGYVCSNVYRNIVGAPVVAKITVKLISEVDNNTIIQTFTQSISITDAHISDSIDTTKRLCLTFNTPNSSVYYDTIQVELSSENSTQWVVWDGIQMIESEYPTLFMEQDDNLFSGVMGDTTGYTVINIKDSVKGVIPLIIQWGQALLGDPTVVGSLYSASTSVTFPITFPNRLIGLFGNASSYKYFQTGYTSVTNTSAILNMFCTDSNTNGAIVKWFALGC